MVRPAFDPEPRDKSDEIKNRENFNIDDFNRDLENFASNYLPEQVVILQKAIALDLLARVVEKTPVDTGRARGGWQIGIDEPSRAETKPNKTGRGPITRGEAKLEKLQPFRVVWVSNNVAYIEFLENGTSQQAPAGMLAVSLEEIRQAFP